MYDTSLSFPRERQEDNVMNKKWKYCPSQITLFGPQSGMKTKENTTTKHLKEKPHNICKEAMELIKKGSKFYELYDFFMRKKDNILFQPIQAVFQ